MLERNIFYKIVNKKPVAVKNLLEMDQGFSDSEWRVNSSVYHGYWVSTVFLGGDYGFGRSQKPILFETMLFDKEGHSVDCTRCCTWDEAVEMHHSMLYKLSVELNIDISYILTNVKEEFESNKEAKEEKSAFANADEFIADLILRFATPS